MPLHEVSLSHTALILVDIQQGTLRNARTIGPDDLLSRVIRLRRHFAEHGRPVVFTVSTGTPPGLTSLGSGGRAWPEEFVAFDPRLTPLADDVVIRRSGWSALSDPGTVDGLRAEAVSNLVIAGMATTFGVESTARAAYDDGFNVVVVSDAVSDPDPVGHDRAIQRIFPVLGQVATTQEVVATLV